jgi:hypothetical protein
MTSSYYTFEEEWEEEEWPAAAIGESIAHDGSLPVELVVIVAASPQFWWRQHWDGPHRG